MLKGYHRQSQQMVITFVFKGLYGGNFRDKFNLYFISLGFLDTVVFSNIYLVDLSNRCTIDSRTGIEIEKREN